jgi:hypothetical protein
VRIRSEKPCDSLLEDDKLPLGILISFFLLWIIFDPIKNIWNDDPFQKIILAPLGEEPFKLLLSAFSLCIAYGLGRLIHHLIHIRGKNVSYNKNMINKEYYFNTVFLKAFIPFSITCGVIFGVSEGHILNVILHASTSSIASVLVLYTYKWLKDKELMTRYKLIIVLSTLSVPMMLHSIFNQYANITYVNNHKEYEYLIIIGRFLSENTPMNNQAVFTIFLLTITLIILLSLLVAWLYKRITTLLKWCC